VLRPLGTAVVLASSVVLAACSGGGEPVVSRTPEPSATVAPTPDLGRFYGQRPRWAGCGGSFECTTIEVPLDYDQPAGQTIELALVRLPAGDPERRIGSLLVNPGGPGASGQDYARAARSAFTDEVRAAYDIVGFDPRGVGESTPVDCVSDTALDAFIAADGSPDDAAEEQQLVADSQAFAAGCGQRSGDLLAHVGTRDAARDMDVIRAVVGDTEMHYFGASYGTFLGATYAELFPANVGRLVLDGAVDPTLEPAELSRGQLGGFETELSAFLTDCVDGAGCPVGPTVEAARAQVEQLLADVDAEPLPSASGRDVTQSLALLGIVYPLYDSRGWPALQIALDRALDGDGSVLLELADLYTDRSSDGSYASNQNEANYAVNCVDRADSSTVDDFRADADELAQESPSFGAYLAWSNLPCTVWPVPASGTAGPLTAAGAAPILVVGTTRDPATPYAWAQALADQLESGRLLTFDGDGHTAYTRGSSCIDDAVDAYLVAGTLPAEGTVCR
jgi:pimeloyl-ACP methyl ester carboxylesterase